MSFRARNFVRPDEARETVAQGQYSVGTLRRHSGLKARLGASSGCMCPMARHPCQSGRDRAEDNQSNGDTSNTETTNPKR